MYALQTSGQRSTQGSAIAAAINANFCSAASTSCAARAAAGSGVVGVAASTFSSTPEEAAFWARPFVRFVPSVVSVYTDTTTWLVSGVAITNGEQGAAKRLSKALLIQQTWAAGLPQLEVEVQLGPGDAVSAIDAVQDKFGVHYVVVKISDGRSSSVGNASYSALTGDGAVSMADWNSNGSALKGPPAAASPLPAGSSPDGAPLLIAVSVSALAGSVVGG